MTSGAYLSGSRLSRVDLLIPVVVPAVVVVGVGIMVVLSIGTGPVRIIVGPKSSSIVSGGECCSSVL